MHRKSSIVLTFILAASICAQAQKRRVAVMDFDYATVRSTVAQIFGSDKDVGRGVADILVDRLVNDGVYSVVERKEIDKVIAEQNFSNSNRADSSTAAKIARILGVDAMIVGSITQFGNDNSSASTQAGALGALTGRFGLGGVEKSKSTAVVQITARLIDSSTAEILASCQGKGQSSRGGVGLLGKGGNVYGPSGGGEIDMKSSGFQNTILGEATNKAVTQAASALEAKAAGLPVAAVHIEGLVADVSDLDAVVINVGSRSGVKVGMVLNVARQGRPVRDPDTGKVLRTINVTVGTIAITDVDADSAVGKFSGSGKPEIRDSVSNK